MVLDYNYDAENSVENRIECFENKICPYCGASLATKSGKRFKSGDLAKKCDNCGKTAYLWYGSESRKNHLLTDEEYKDVKVEDDKNSLVGFIQKCLNDIGVSIAGYEQLYNKYNKDKIRKNYFDILWELLNKKLIEHITNRAYGSYRWTKYIQSEVLFREKRYNQCIETLFEVLYYDINGASDSFGFVPDNSFIPPVIIEDLYICAKKLNLTYDELNKIFEDVTKKIKLPIASDKIWEKILPELKKCEKSYLDDHLDML